MLRTSLSPASAMRFSRFVDVEPVLVRIEPTITNCAVVEKRDSDNGSMSVNVRRDLFSRDGLMNSGVFVDDLALRVSLPGRCFDRVAAGVRKKCEEFLEF